MKTATARVKMLGNFREYEVDKEYDLELDLANQFTGMGIAVFVEQKPAAAPAKE